MNSSSIFRRSVAVLGSAGAAAALALIPSTAAHASVKAEFVAEGQAGANYVGPTVGGSCTLTSGATTTQSSGVTFHNGTRRQAVNVGATFTSSDNSADKVKVKGHVKSALSITRKGGSLSSLDLNADAAVTITHTVSGSACQGSGAAFGVVPLLNFTESKKGRLDISYKSSQPQALLAIAVFSYKTQQAVLQVVNVGDHTQGTAHVTLKPGKYAVAQTEVGVFSGILFAKRATLSQKVAKSVDIKATFTPHKH